MFYLGVVKALPTVFFFELKAISMLQLRLVSHSEGLCNSWKRDWVCAKTVLIYICEFLETG
jgi:hypothetical protein